MWIRKQGQSLAVDSPAKLNLFLEVSEKRADGFHEIETVMTRLDLYDTLLFTPNDSSKINLDCQFVHSAPDEAERAVLNSNSNLVFKAVELLKNKTGYESGVDIVLQKRIPSQAGLAGGSSNAAATFVALNQLWNLNLSLAELEELASQLGSDIGFFFSPRPTAVCTGRGEKIKPLSNSVPISFVVLKPKSGLSTAKVYKNCKVGNPVRTAETVVEALESGDLSKISMEIFNALQAPAEELNTDVRETLELLNQQPVMSTQMTGSGSACFAICKNHKQAQSIASRLRGKFSGDVFVARSLA